MNEVDRNALFVLGIIVCLYVFDFVAARFLTSSLIWITYVRVGISVLICIVLLKRPKTIKEAFISERMRVIVNSLVFASLYVVLFVALGLMDGFGNNPFNTNPLSILLNLLVFMPKFILFEVVRDAVLNRVDKSHRGRFQLLIIVIFTIAVFTPRKWSVLFSGELESIVEFLGQGVLPEISKNILLNRTVLLGGVVPGTIIQMGFQSIMYIFPVLPNLRWITESLLHVVYPIMGISLIEKHVRKRDQSEFVHRVEDRSLFGTMVWGLVSIVLVWFSVGIFPIFPTLILTGSMEPYIYPGDIVIVQTIEEKEELEVGDVIQFWAENIFIIHRIIDIEQDGYKTKGDNNNTADSDLVKLEQIKGKMIGKIPVIGKPVVYFRIERGQSLDKIAERFGLGED